MCSQLAKSVIITPAGPGVGIGVVMTPHPLPAKCTFSFFSPSKVKVTCFSRFACDFCSFLN